MSLSEPVITGATKIATRGWLSLCAKLAPASSLVLIMAPLPTMQKIAQDNTVGDLPLLPYSSMFVNTFIWTTYGFLLHDPRLWIPNVLGVALGLYYFSQFSKFCSKNASGLPGTVSHHLQIARLLVLFTFLAAYFMPREIALSFVGMEGIIISIILLASPLSSIKAVMESKSAESIPITFTLACLANTVLWFVLGFFDMHDAIIYGPNIIGILSSIMQLLLKVIYTAGSNVKVSGSKHLEKIQIA